jgi:hypothetical protein
MDIPTYWGGTLWIANTAGFINSAFGWRLRFVLSDHVRARVLDQRGRYAAATVGSSSGSNGSADELAGLRSI